MKKRMFIDKATPLQVGIVQGGLVSLYVVLFATTVVSLDGFTPEKSAPALAVTMFLLVFIISALVCGGLVLGYPLVLAFNGNIKRALQVIAWTGTTLLAVAVIVVAIILTTL